MLQRENSDRFEMLNIFKVLVMILILYLMYDSLNHSNSPPNVIVRINDPKFKLLGPYSSIEYQVDDVYNKLIDLSNFSFIINPQPCKGYEAGLLLLIIVASNPNNFGKRSVIRNTWGRSVDSTKVVFLMGDSENVTLSKIIKKESNKFGDIVQGNFVDAYRNMTYKHIMGLKWVAYHCPSAKYVLKTDDDIVVNSHELREFLARELSPWGANDLIACELMLNSKAQRTSQSKWMVTKEEYADEYYPTYCAGWSILYSQDVIFRLLAVSRTVPYFWIDDVHITGVMAEKIKVDRISFANLVLTKSRANLLTSRGPKYSGRFLIGPFDLSIDRISEIWKAIPQ